MAQSNQDSAALRSSVDNYYKYNPDTLMPLLMLALASQGKLQVGNTIPAEATKFASINIAEVKVYEWVKLNPALKKRLKAAQNSGAENVAVFGEIPEELNDIYDIFYKYDNETVVQEFHHRVGILTDHSSNAPSEKAQRQYATILFAENLCSIPQAKLQEEFLIEANRLLVKSGLQPKRPRIRVAQALCALLSYDGRGVVYNPYAGCAIAGAMIGAGSNLYADGDRHYDKLTAVARLLCYGTGQRGYNIEPNDSTKWLTQAKPDYVLSTFLGYPEGKSAFDFCLGKCLENFKDSGKYAGIVAPKDIFEKLSPEMKEALNRDWIDTIVLLPFGEVAVLADAAKPNDRKKKIRFYNMTHPMLSHRPVINIIGDDDYADILKVSDVKKRGYLKSLVTPEIEQREGCEIITLGDIYEKVSRQTWSLSKVAADDRVMAKIDRAQPYDEWKCVWMNGIDKEPISSLFSPAYKLDEDCLIVNNKGGLEPRLYDAEQGNAFFQEGFAFKEKFFDEDINYDWLVHELCQPYVDRQLHPYGEDEMLPEKYTEEQVLRLKINRPLPVEKKKVVEEDADNGKLPAGTMLKGEMAEYTIHRFLGHGHFGYAYTAASHNVVTGENKEVVLKEFFPRERCYREGIKAVLNDSDYQEWEWWNDNIAKFKEEAEIMHKLGLTEDSHIVPAYEFFSSEETETSYYVMPFYKDGSFEDLQNSGYTFSEDMLIQHVVIPMCKALNVAHKNKALHLDIKPENILVDEQGDAVLIDFGVAKQYDNDNNIINRVGSTSRSCFAAPELKVCGALVHFGEQPDIFGLAATLYYLATERETPHPIMELSNQDEDIRGNLDFYNFSKQFADAIVAGLQNAVPSRPKNAQAFLNLFPGCENIKL